MNKNIREIINEIEELKKRLKEEIKKEEQNIPYEFHRQKVLFSKEMMQEQKKHLIHLFQYIKEAPFINILSAPIIYMMIIPAVVLDLFMFVYVKVVFKVYKFPPISRSDYIVFDRHYLGYLNALEKLNCLYCSYFNGLINYTAAVASRTELYFCPIKHAKKIAYEHHFYYEFLPYGDAKTYHQNLKECRQTAQHKA